MDYRNYNGTYYIRLDRGDEIIGSILKICKDNSITSAIYSGIGGLSEAQIQTFIPEKGEFETETIEGMLELMNLTGNVVTDEDNKYYQHTHAAVAYKSGNEHFVRGGHIKSLTVLYTAEIELRPVVGGTIKHVYNPETGTGFWGFGE